MEEIKKEAKNKKLTQKQKIPQMNFEKMRMEK